jgi:hypothetical protein
MVAPGGKLDVRWETSRTLVTEPMTQMEFQIRGLEIIAIGEGEEHEREQRIFFSKDYPVKAEDVAQGTMSFNIPDKSPLTFHGRFNHIQWEIGLTLITKDERLYETFDFKVLPTEARA